MLYILYILCVFPPVPTKWHHLIDVSWCYRLQVWVPVGLCDASWVNMRNYRSFVRFFNIKIHFYYFYYTFFRRKTWTENTQNSFIFLMRLNWIRTKKRNEMFKMSLTKILNSSENTIVLFFLVFLLLILFNFLCISVIIAGWYIFSLFLCPFFLVVPCWLSVLFIYYMLKDLVCFKALKALFNANTRIFFGRK